MVFSNKPETDFLGFRELPRLDIFLEEDRRGEVRPLDKPFRLGNEQNMSPSLSSSLLLSCFENDGDTVPVMNACAVVRLFLLEELALDSEVELIKLSQSLVNIESVLGDENDVCHNGS